MECSDGQKNRLSMSFERVKEISDRGTRMTFYCGRLNSKQVLANCSFDLKSKIAA
jgi:hypothetical protein